MRPLRDILVAEAALAGLIDRRQHELALLQLLRRLLPPALASQIGVADATRPELLLATASGAAATLVRHRAPDVLEGLAREGWKFTGIRVRVQAHKSSGHTSKVYAKQMSPQAVAALQKSAAQITDPVLAAALRRLAGRGAGRSESQHQPFEGVEQQDAGEKK
jgi:hypothetical protein